MKVFGDVFDQLIELGGAIDKAIRQVPGASDVAVVTANVRNRDLGSFVSDVQQAVAKQVEIPPGYWIEYGGTFQQMQSATKRLTFVVPVTLLLILGLLVTALGSLRDAAVIFTNVPMALTGGIMALLIRGIPFSISADGSEYGYRLRSTTAIGNGRHWWHYFFNLTHPCGFAGSVSPGTRPGRFQSR